jgi:hypothetical protein
MTGRIIAPFINVKLPRASLLGQRARHGNIQDSVALPLMARLDRSCRRSNSSGSRVNRTGNRAVTVHPQANAAQVA